MNRPERTRLVHRQYRRCRFRFGVRAGLGKMGKPNRFEVFCQSTNHATWALLGVTGRRHPHRFVAHIGFARKQSP